MGNTAARVAYRVAVGNHWSDVSYLDPDTAPKPSAPPLYDPTRMPFGIAPPAAPDEGPSEDDADDSVKRLAIAVGVAALVAAAMAGLLVLLFVERDQVVSLGGSGAVADSNLELAGESLDVQAVLSKVSGSVVSLETNIESSRGIFGGAGSGVVITTDGLVLTNAHVVNGADVIDVTFFNGVLLQAEVVGSFPDEDIAVLQVEGVSDTLPADLGTVEATRVGDEVLAIGNALGLGGLPTVTQGIVSAKDREITSGRLSFTSLIQTDAAINPGNSGGPLVNAAGEVIGINTAIIDGAQNVGFAISIDLVVPLIEQLLDGDGTITPQTGWLGASTESVERTDPADLARYGVTAPEGAVVLDVFPNSAAARGGLELGDVVTSINGRSVSTPEDVAREVRRFDPGDAIELEVQRGSEQLSLDIALGTRADAGG